LYQGAAPDAPQVIENPMRLQPLLDLVRTFSANCSASDKSALHDYQQNHGIGAQASNPFDRRPET
jgi:hypothetical protein